MSGRDGSVSEFSLIERLFAPLSDEAHGFGLKDDVGRAPFADSGLCVTTDMIVAGVHFFADDPAGDIARKLVRVNVSDLAAKGARPTACLLSAGFSSSRDIGWIEIFAQGLAEDLAAYGMVLIGGDTVRTPGPDCFSLTAMGEMSGRGHVSRSGAQVGDGVYVTGTIGDAGLGLKILRGELGAIPLGRRKPLVERYHVPDPKLAFGQHLPGFATAALDVSDGLVADAGHLASTSGVGMQLMYERIPLSTSASRLVKGNEELHRALLTAGDDYEILFTVPPGASEGLVAASGETDTPVTRIGEIVADDACRVQVIDSTGKMLELSQTGYRHF